MKLLPAFFCLILLCSCKPTYYKAMETFGVHKRDILVNRVKDSRESQQEAKEQFKTTLERFTELTGFDGGDLAKTYEKLNRELLRSEERAGEVNARIKATEQVAKDLFKEWEKELKQYENADLRRTSKQQMDLTRERYAVAIAALKKAARAINPVLKTFRDQVLYLKHNLNAQAIASLDSQKNLLHSDIASLVAEMERAIAEADTFIHSMRQPQ
jgi:hypothetical protein